jgi:Terminase large subunit, T4likevirus-type, N-terminal
LGVVLVSEDVHTFSGQEPWEDGEIEVIEPEVLDPVEFARTRLKFEPDERQIEVLRSEAKRGILNCTRQWGKSTIAAAKAVHRAFTRPKSLVLVASPTDRQSGVLIQKAAEMVRTLGIRPRGDGDNETSLLLPNGSRIVGLPGTEGTVRGFSAVSLLLIDEASRVDDAMYKALRPMLAGGQGDLWLMSTPCGKRGFFYECWEHEGSDWFRVSVPATECPRIPAEFLEEERRAIGPLWFAQEYLGEFVDNGTAVFGRDLVERAVDDSFGPIEV